MYEVQHDEIARGERGERLLSNTFEKPKERYVLDVAPQGQRHLELVGAREVRARFPLADRLLEHPIGSLPRPLDEAALRERLGKAPVSRCLTPEDVLRGHSRRESARADHLDAAGVEPYEDRTRGAVVAMADRVQDRLTCGDLVDRRDVADDETVAELLHLVSSLDEPEEFVEVTQEPCAELGALLRSDASVRGAVFDDRFCLREVLSESLRRPEEDERRDGDAAFDQQLGVFQELIGGNALQLFVAGSAPPELSEPLDRRSV